MYAMLMAVMLDGSTVNLNSPDVNVDIMTAYGRLQIPIKEVQKIEFGAHAADEAAMSSVFPKLASERYEERRVAVQYIKDNLRGSYKHLLRHQNSDIPEIKIRVEQALKLFSGAYPPTEDVVYTKSMTARGDIRNLNFSGNSESLGEMVLQISKLNTIDLRQPPLKTTLKHSDGWLNLGYRRGRLDISASGSIDLWPQQPGGYQCGPRGYSAQKDGFNAGALIGRLNGGSPFIVGDRCVWSDISGTLEVRINDGTWGSNIEGAFELEVK